jgi:hypothetical protein
MGQGVPVAENDGDVTSVQVLGLVYFHVKSGTVRGQDLAHLTAQRTQLRLVIRREGRSAHQGPLCEHTDRGASSHDPERSSAATGNAYSR